MGQALYRKYRSKNLSEIIGQAAITRTLETALNNHRISHAYLLTGPRGVGKTSVARILAHAVNDLPYTNDGAHIDIIEIDAASNRRIDEIRDLREKVHIAPALAKYKVYIIDEVHMLTKEAFNALLKTLEEPPAHVIFILATTDAHKLPATIVSRTQRFNFLPIDPALVAKHLAAIAKRENLDITTEALELLAEHGEGSFRDSISMLDQVASLGEQVTAVGVQQLLGIPPQSAIQSLLSAVKRGERAELMKICHEIFSQGYQASTVAKQLSGRLRQTPEKLTSPDLDLLKKLLEVPVSQNPEQLLEIVLLQATLTSTSQANIAPSTIAMDEKSPTALAKADDKASTAKSNPLPKRSSTAKKSVVTETLISAPSKTTKPKANSNREFDASVWQDVLTELKKQHNALYSIVRMAEPTLREPQVLELSFAFPFHQKRLADTANQAVLKNVVDQITGQNIIIECVVTDSTKPPHISVALASEPKQDIATINNIFGGGELLESE